MSKNKTPSDPYLYPNTSVLINKFGLKDQDALKEMEGFIFALKNSGPLPGGIFDYVHLKAIHCHFFGDIYEWAGQERTIDIAKGDSYFCHTQYQYIQASITGFLHGNYELMEAILKNIASPRYHSQDKNKIITLEY